MHAAHLLSSGRAALIHLTTSSPSVSYSSMSGSELLHSVMTGTHEALPWIVRGWNQGFSSATTFIGLLWSYLTRPALLVTSEMLGFHYPRPCTQE